MQLHERTSAATILTALLAGGAGADTIESHFEFGSPEGWTFSGDVETEGLEFGGPGDSNLYLQVVDQGAGPTIQAIAPSYYLGDWTAFDEVGTLSADVGLLDLVVGGNQIVPMGFTIEGPGGSATRNFEIPPVGPWLHYTTPVREQDWTVTAGTWAALLQDVTSFRIRAEFGTGLDVVGLDNIRLTSEPVLRWWTLDGGGGTASNGPVVLHGTIGQIDAGTLAAGDVALRGGFWTGGEDAGIPCPADIDGDGAVNVSDLLAVIVQWGICAVCPADINDDGLVDVLDLLEVITSWGPCP